VYNMRNIKELLCWSCLRKKMREKSSPFRYSTSRLLHRNDFNLVLGCDRPSRKMPLYGWEKLLIFFYVRKSERASTVVIP
jgi:hypothetical protein